MRVAVYSQPTQVGVMGGVAYADHMQAGFIVPPGTMGSSPIGGGVAGRTNNGPSSPPRGFRGTPDNAKTKICMRWMAGDCRFGDHCNFAHGESELRTPPPRDNVMQPFPKQNGYVVDPYSMRPSPFAYSSAGFPSPVYMVSPQHSQSSPVGGHPMFMKPAIRTPSVDTAVAVSPVPSTSINTSFSAPSNYGQSNVAGKPAEMSMEAWTASGCPVLGANGWCKYTTPDGDDYYHNFISSITQWEEPSEFVTQTQRPFICTPVKS